MTDRSKEILDLINSNGKNASAMTSALKKIGDGDMQKGLDILANYFKNTGISIGEKNGWIKGSATTLGITLAIGSGVYFVDRYKKYRAKKELELTEEKIIETLKEASEQDNKNIDSLEYEEEIFNEKSSTLKETFNDCVDKELM